jgi:hypothetical protein
MYRLVAFALCVAAGCVSAPSAFGARSPASVEAENGPRVTVGRALTEEPPAPGASTEGWAGLAGTAAPSAHAHHHLMRMPDGTMMEMDAMPGASSTEAPDAQ